MKALLIDVGGARQHALAEKMAESPLVDEVFVTNGNPGMEDCAVDVGFDAMDLGRQVDFVRRNKNIGLIAVTGDDPLAAGIADNMDYFFGDRGTKVFGPTKSAAEIEWSKWTGKTCMIESGVPTAGGGAFSSMGPALVYAADQSFPLYAKFDHLARGKGVFKCSNIEQLELTLLEIQAMGKMSVNDMVIIEEGLPGLELSLQAWCDGDNYQMVPFAMKDHKTIFDYDEGPMTGGMAVVTIPTSDVSVADVDLLGERFVAPKLRWLKQRGTPFRGMLYPGLRGGRCLEDNARPGDAEAQAWLARLRSDVVELMIASTSGDLHNLTDVEWDTNESICLVLAAEGYPDNPKQGAVIEGLEDVEKLRSQGVRVLHAGTGRHQGNLVVKGGRVLNVVVTGQDGESLQSVCERAQSAAKLIHFKGKQVRSDAGDTVVAGEYKDFVLKNVA